METGILKINTVQYVFIPVDSLHAFKTYPLINRIHDILTLLNKQKRVVAANTLVEPFSTKQFFSTKG